MVKDELLLMPGGLFSLSGRLSAAWRKKLKYSFLFTCLYARKSGDKFRESAKWHLGYSLSMEKLEWATLVNNVSSFEPQDDAVFVLRELLKERLVAHVQPQEAMQLERLIASVEMGLGSEAQGAAIREQTLCTVDAQDMADTIVFVHLSVLGSGPVVHSVSVRFRTSECIDEDFFSQVFTGKYVVGEVSVNVCTRQLSTGRYERNAIEAKVRHGLPDAADALIVELAPAGH